MCFLFTAILASDRRADSLYYPSTTNLRAGSASLIMAILGTNNRDVCFMN